jgi:hypothetical protein
VEKIRINHDKNVKGPAWQSELTRVFGYINERGVYLFPSVSSGQS